jgi:hypothetical protein
VLAGRAIAMANWLFLRQMFALFFLNTRCLFCPVTVQIYLSRSCRI